MIDQTHVTYGHGWFLGHAAGLAGSCSCRPRKYSLPVSFSKLSRRAFFHPCVCSVHVLSRIDPALSILLVICVSHHDPLGSLAEAMVWPLPLEVSPTWTGDDWCVQLLSVLPWNVG